jgi:NAD(P)-dependent dehydrogenase (short-subunit alcohol dehydrogenase family)
MQRLLNKVALITGGGSGIGLASAHAMVKEGAKVILFGRDASRLDDARALLGEAVTTLVGDVTNLADLDQLYIQIQAQHGGLDVLFANAGVARIRTIEAVDEAAFDETFDTNARGTFFTVQKAIPLLRPGASVIMNTSVANQAGVVGMSLYAASKAAVRSFVRCFAAELVGKQIRVNAISPGPTWTPIHTKYGVPEEMLEGMAKATLDLIPLKRMADPAEIAAAVVFLASPDSSFVLGEELVVDGGTTSL